MLTIYWLSELSIISTQTQKITQANIKLGNKKYTHTPQKRDISKLVHHIKIIDNYYSALLNTHTVKKNKTSRDHLYSSNSAVNTVRDC